MFNKYNASSVFKWGVAVPLYNQGKLVAINFSLDIESIQVETRNHDW